MKIKWILLSQTIMDIKGGSVKIDRIVQFSWFQTAVFSKKKQHMKKIIIAALMGCSFQEIKAQEPNEQLFGIYKSTISQACIVIYKSNRQLRAKAYEDFALIKKSVYSKGCVSRLLDDKNCPDFVVSYSESVFENLHSENDLIAFTIPEKNEGNKTMSNFFAKAGTKFKPLKVSTYIAGNIQ